MPNTAWEDSFLACKLPQKHKSDVAGSQTTVAADAEFKEHPDHLVTHPVLFSTVMWDCMC